MAKAYPEVGEWWGDELYMDGVKIGCVYEYKSEWMGEREGRCLQNWHISRESAMSAVERDEVER